MNFYLIRDIFLKDLLNNEFDFIKVVKLNLSSIFGKENEQSNSDQIKFSGTFKLNI